MAQSIFLIESAIGTQRKKNSIWYSNAENTDNHLASYVPWENALKLINVEFIANVYLLTQEALVILLENTAFGCFHQELLKSI